MINKNDIIVDQQELCDKILQYSEQQVDNWRLIPYLSLLSDGRSGWSDQKRTCYYNGYYIISSIVSQGCYRYKVDCETGKIVHVGGQPVDADRDLLEIDLNDIDTTLIIDELRKDIIEPIGEYYKKHGGNMTEERLKQIVEETNLQPIYKRVIND